MQDSPHHAMSQKTGQTTTGDVESPDGARGSHPFGTYASDFEPPPGASLLCPEVSKALSGVLLIAEQKKRNEECTKVLLVNLFKFKQCGNFLFIINQLTYRNIKFLR